MGSPASSLMENVQSDVVETPVVPADNISITLTLSQAQFARLVQASQGGIVFNVEDSDLTRLGLIQSQGGETGLFVASSAGRYVLDQIQASQTAVTRH